MAEFPAVSQTTDQATIPQNTISVDPYQGAQPETLSVDPMSDVSTPVSPAAADQRSFKAYYGLGDILQKSRQEIYGDLVQGNEGALRQQAASTIDQRKFTATNNAIAEFAKRKGGALSGADVDFLKNAVSSLDEKTDPNSVFETAFAREYISSLDRTSQRIPSNFLTQAAQQIPVEKEQTFKAGELMSAKTEMLDRYAQDFKDQVEKQGYLSWGADQAKFLFPGVTDYYYRGNVPDVSKFGLLGLTMQHQAEELIGEPDFTKFKQKIDFAKQQFINNPSAGATFFEALRGMSSSDVILNSAFPMLDYTMLGGVAKRGVGLTASLLGKAKLFNETQTAVKTMLKAVSQSDVSPSTVAAAAGDLKEAAISKQTADIIAARAGLPQETQRGVEATTSDLRIDMQARGLSPGRGGQEIVNRLNERTQYSLDAYEKMITAAAKVERMPELTDTLAVETVNRALEEDIYDKYKFLRNRILDVTPAYKEPITGNWFKDIVVGDHGGRYFANSSVRDNFQRDARLSGSFSGTSASEVAIGPEAGITNANAIRIGRLQSYIKDLEENQIPKRQFEANSDTSGTFKTSKGSVYTRHEDNTTTRIKAPRNEPGHEGDEGLKDRSVRTVYVTRENAERLSVPQGNWKIIQSNNSLSVATPKNLDWGIAPSQRNIPYKTQPEVGLHPVELWNRAMTKGSPSYGKIHIGNDITETNSVNLGITPEKRAYAQEQVKGLQKGLEKYKSELNQLQGTPNQQGIGHYIRVSVPVDETTGRMRDAYQTFAKTEGSKTFSPDKLLNFLIGKIRTPDETMSLAQLENRKVTTVGPHIAIDFLQDSAKEIKQLIGWKGLGSRDRWRKFSKVVNAATGELDEDGQLGKFFKSPGEFEEFYGKTIGHAPDEQTVRAYFAFTDAMEFDRQFRNIAEHKVQLRSGAQTHQFRMLDKDGKQLLSPEFSGVVRESFHNGGQGNVLVVGDKVGQEEVKAMGHINSTLAKKYDEGIKDGTYRFIEAWAPEQRPFLGLTDEVGNKRIRYVLAKNVETKPLAWNHVPRRGGGHIVYDTDRFLKQAIVKTEQIGEVRNAIYEGDRTIAAVGIRAMGNNFAKHLNVVREMLKAKDLAGAEAYSNTNLHINWERINSWFNPTRDPVTGHITPAMLSHDEPIQVVPKGGQIIGIDNTLKDRYRTTSDGKSINWIDGTRSGSLNRQFQVDFTGERDAEGLSELVDKGSRNNPLYDLAPAEILDPITTMNRALTRIINTNYMDDYKMFSIEHWIAAARQWLKPDVTKLEHSPFWHFKNPDWLPNTPNDVRRKLEAEHMNILGLTGELSQTDVFLQNTAQKLLDATYTKLGPKGVLIDPKWALPILRDPTRFIRSVVFHTTLGLFNLPQFLVQSMNYVNILGIAGPKYALSGMYAAQLHFWSTVNSHPEIIEHLDNMATKLGIPGLAHWKPGEFKESINEMAKTGFGNVGREISTLDDVMGTKVIQQGWRNFLDAGTIFFRGGERNARYGAWHTAFKEFRDANPTKVLDNADRLSILNRADTLNINMTRASSSMLHKGILSIPTQFYAYQLRLTELFTGSRLTNLERARLFGANALAFGVPVGTGLIGFPFVDNLRQAALDNGYVVGDNFWTSLAMEGVPSALTNLTTGKWLNFGDRYGSKGFDNISNTMRTDRTILDLAGGAAYSKMKSAYEDTDGFRAWVMSAVRDDNKYFKIQPEHFFNIFKEVSSVNSGERLWGAINTGKWLSKQGVALTDISPMSAMIQSLTGLQDQNVADITRMTASMQDAKALQDRAEKKFLQELHKFYMAHSQNNPEQADAYMANGLAWLRIANYPPEKFTSLVAMGSSGENQTLVNTIKWDYYIKYANEANRIQKYNAFVRSNSENK